ncbi:MAG: hypothetical protein ABIU54_07145 [Candidatus Eisenbacteria bacterium]
MSAPNDSRAIDRRQFMQLLGAAGVASVLPGATAAVAQAPPTPAASTPAPTHPPEVTEDARALVGILKRRYPGRFSDSKGESIARDFDGDLALGKRLRGMKLKNSDEPDSTFKA